MTTRVLGLAVGARHEPVGTELTADVPTGSTVLPVDWADLFDDAGGVLATIDPGSTNPDAYLFLDYEPYVEGDTSLTLTVPTVVDLYEGDRVYVVDGGMVRVDYVLDVDLGGDDEADEAADTVTIPIPYEQRDLWPEGEYDDPVPVVVNGGLTQLLDVPGRTPVRDGAYIDPGTLPAVPGGGPSEPPAASPAVRVTGTADALVVRVVDEVDPSTLLTYHVTATPPLDANGDPLDFTPTAATQIGIPTRSTLVVITALPDGTRLATDTTYYVRVVASNDLGTAPPGPMASGSLDPSVVSEIVATEVSAGFLLAGSIRVGQITINPDTGITIPTEGGGITLPADGSAATFSGEINTARITVQDNLTIRGKLNTIGGQLTLANVVQAPNVAPTVSWDHPVEPEVVESGTDARGFVDSVDGTEWVVVNSGFAGIITFDKATGTMNRLTGLPGDAVAHGITRIGSRYYVVGYDAARENVRVWVLDSAFNRITDWLVTSTNNTPTAPTIGTTADRTQLLVAWWRTQQDIRVRHYDVAGNQTWTQLYGYGAGPYGLWGAVQINTSKGTETLFCSGAIITYDDANPGNYGESLRLFDRGMGMFHDGTRVKVLGSSTKVPWALSTNEWPNTLSVTSTYYDSDPAGTGTHETTAGPTNAYRPPRFSWMRVAPPMPGDGGLPDDPNKAGVYVANRLLEFVDPAVSPLSRLYEVIPTTGKAAPTTNEFVNATAQPGSIQSSGSDASGPIFWVQGDGRGRAGPFQWTNTGALINGIWRYVGDPSMPPFENGWKNNASLRRLKFRRTPMDTLTIYGQIIGGANGTNIFTLPEGFRPNETLADNLTYWANAGPSRYCIINIGSGGGVSFWQGGNSGGSYISIALTGIPLD